MSFKHPAQHGHMRAGQTAASQSKKTPAHLRPHLARVAGTPAPGNQSLPANSQPVMQQSMQSIMEGRPMSSERMQTPRAPNTSSAAAGKSMAASSASDTSTTRGPKKPKRTVPSKHSVFYGNDVRILN